MKGRRKKARLPVKSVELTARDIVIASVTLTTEERLALIRSIRDVQKGPFEPLSKDVYREGPAVTVSLADGGRGLKFCRLDQ